MLSPNGFIFEENLPPFRIRQLRAIVPEFPGVPIPTLTMANVLIPKQLVLPSTSQSHKWEFFAAIVVNDRELAMDQLSQAKKLAEANQLTESHVDAWLGFWNDVGGRVEIKGNCSLAQTVHASFYYILSSLPSGEDNDSWPFFQIGPGGLPHSGARFTYGGMPALSSMVLMCRFLSFDDFCMQIFVINGFQIQILPSVVFVQILSSMVFVCRFLSSVVFVCKFLLYGPFGIGRAFWDQETWMLPPILPFAPQVVAKVLKDSRIRRIAGAQLKATSLGFQGAMFPWEAGYTGP